MAHLQRRRSTKRDTSPPATPAYIGDANSAEHRLARHYRIVSQTPIGRGAFGTVIEGVDERTGVSVAIKRIDKVQVGDKGIRSLRGEVETMRMLSHPSIVKLLEVVEDAAVMFIVMELVRQGDLAKVLQHHGGAFPETTVQRIALQLLSAVDYLHRKGLVHRDLKLANCLVSGLQYRPASYLEPSTVLARATSAAASPAGSPSVRSAGQPLQGPLASARRSGFPPPLSSSPFNSPPTCGHPSAPPVPTESNRDCPAILPERASSIEVPLINFSITAADIPGTVLSEYAGQGSSRTAGSIESGRSPRRGTTDSALHDYLSLPPPSAGDPEPTISVKIADFGFSVMVGDVPCLTKYCGTQSYMAPEILASDDGGGYGKPVDLWAVGVMLFTMLIGEFPFRGRTSDDQVTAILNGQYDPNLVPWSTEAAKARWRNVSSSAKDMLQQLLQVDPTARTVARDAVLHPWVSAALSHQEDDSRRMGWLQGQIDDGFRLGLLDSTSWPALGLNGSSSTMFATPEGARSASEAAWLVAARTVSTEHTMTRLRRGVMVSRFRAAVTAVRAALRLTVFTKLRALRSDTRTAEINLFQDFSYLARGVFAPVWPEPDSTDGSKRHHRGLRTSHASSRPVRSPAIQPDNTLAARPLDLFRGNRSAVQVLLSMTEACSSVRTLDLSDVGLDCPDTMQRAARIASAHPTLETLNLSGNDLTPIVGRTLVRLTRTTVSLREVVVRPGQLPGDVAHAIRQNLVAAVARGAGTPAGATGEHGVRRRQGVPPSAPVHASSPRAARRASDQIRTPIALRPRTDFSISSLSATTVDPILLSSSSFSPPGSPTIGAPTLRGAEPAAGSPSRARLHRALSFGATTTTTSERPRRHPTTPNTGGAEQHRPLLPRAADSSRPRPRTSSVRPTHR